MNNWIVIKNKNHEQKDVNCFEGYLCERLANTTIFFKRDGRFVHDELFAFNNSCMLISDGVVLNLAELKLKYDACDIHDVIKKIKNEDEFFFAKFVGPFCGTEVDQRGKIVGWGNQTGDAPLFYCNSSEFFGMSNDLNMIVELLREKKVTYHLNENSAMQVMTFGFLVDDGTMIAEIKRLQPGKFLTYENGEIKIERYHRFNFSESEMSFDEALEQINIGFRAALKRCFDKDLEYNRVHLADISAGLDTRMVNWVARDMGYENIVNCHYSQSGSDEAKYASTVSLFLGNIFNHYYIDNAKFVYDIDDIIHLNYGLAVFCGITGGQQMLSNINFDKFGLEHTGQLENITSFGNTECHIPPTGGDLRYSNLLKYEVPEEVLVEYMNNEEYLYYCRGFQGSLSTHLIRRHYTYAVAPFIDPDFFQLCCNLPMKYKKDHQLYWAWIEKYYPQAAKIPASRKKDKITIKMRLIQWYSRGKSLCRRILHAFGMRETMYSPNGMNPFDYWYDTMPELRDFAEQYYYRNRTLLDNYPKTLKGVDELFASKRTMDKMLAITVLGTMKAYFREK